jgi:phosphatidylinositol-3,4,5-trisphosphate 3-phosphatase and dual-specificity protein phosphatase PTEN
MFGDERTNDGKGVTIPSQMRYVHYYEALRRGHSDVSKVYQIRHVRLHTVPNFDIEGGSDPFFDVRLGDGRECIFNLLQASGGRVKHYYPKERLIDLDVERFNIRVKGDVKMVFYDFDEVGSPDKMYHFWFNTAFVDNNYLLLHKAVLDRACKDKTCKEFEADFKMEIFLDCVDEKEGEFDKIKGEYLHDDVDEGGEGDEEEEGAE